jgi:RHS repeat-associated protein
MPPALVTMTYDGDDRVTSFNGEEVTQDPDGNMTRGPLASGFADFNYDARNRLISAGGLSYTYDAENRRISSSGPDGTTSYVNNPNSSLWQVLEIRPPGASSPTYCVYGVGLIYTETGGQPLYHHYDLRGSTVVTTDQSGAVVSEFAYDPYGIRRDVRLAGGSAGTPFLFVGQWGVMTDANELCFSRARYYSPLTHRFINADPIGFAGGMNWYSYANANPKIFIDPAGNRGVAAIADVLNNAVQSFRAGADTYFHHRSAGRTTAEALTLGFSSAKSNFLVGLTPTGKSSLGELVVPVVQAAAQEAISQLHKREFSWNNFQTEVRHAAAGSIRDFAISKILRKDVPGLGLFITTGGYLVEYGVLLRDMYSMGQKEHWISQNWNHNIDLQIKLAQRSAREQIPFLDHKLDDRNPEAMNAAFLASEKPPQ